MTNLLISKKTCSFVDAFGNLSRPRVLQAFLGLAFVSLLFPGIAAVAQSASSSAQNLTTADTATGAQSATAAKAESLTVASKEYDAAKELSRMIKRYGLTKERKSNIQPLLLEQQKQVHTLGEDTSLTDAEWVSAVRKVHQQTVSQVKLLLTDSQLSKYVKDEAKRAKQSGNDSDDDGFPPFGPPPGGGGGPPGGGGPGGGGPPG
jgi:hypothetical protein